MAHKTKSKGLGTLSDEVFDLIRDLDADERAKLIRFVMQRFDDDNISNDQNGITGLKKEDVLHTATQNSGQLAKKTPQSFFAEKCPANKGEMLAVAARFREMQGNDHHTLEDFAKFFSDARQNFDRGNFARDIKNAQAQAKLFNTGGERARYQLSYFGQQYVDVMPDREKVKKLKRPGKKKSVNGIKAKGK